MAAALAARWRRPRRPALLVDFACYDAPAWCAGPSQTLFSQQKETGQDTSNEGGEEERGIWRAAVGSSAASRLCHGPGGWSACTRSLASHAGRDRGHSIAKRGRMAGQWKTGPAADHRGQSELAQLLRKRAAAQPHACRQPQGGGHHQHQFAVRKQGVLRGCLCVVCRQRRTKEEQLDTLRALVGHPPPLTCLIL